MSAAAILIVDDDELMGRNLLASLDALGHEGEWVTSAAQCLDALRRRSFDVVLSDYVMAGLNGLELMQQIRKAWPKLPVLIMTGHANPDLAIESIKLGAVDFLEKPFSLRQLGEALDAAIAAGRAMSSPVALGESAGGGKEAIIGRSPAMMAVFKEIGRVAGLPVPVLIRGETGVGKDLVARAIYHHSARADKVFVALNCAAIPETLLESELFGHERGAFTGAVARRIGKFEQADGGTLFLDEIGDMTAQTQAKLLRVLQDGSYRRLGSNVELRADVRLITATNRPIEAMIREGRFREDLFHRVNTVTIRIPPLRERKGDIPLLAAFFLSRSAAAMGIEAGGITPSAIRHLDEQSWPGNVRELENVISRALILSRGAPLTAEHVRHAIEQPLPPAPQAGDNGESGGGGDSEGLAGEIERALALAEKGEVPAALPYLLSRIEPTLYRRAFERSGGNKSLAARLIGVTTPTLRAKLRQISCSGHRANTPPIPSSSAGGLAIK